MAEEKTDQANEKPKEAPTKGEQSTEKEETSVEKKEEKPKPKEYTPEEIEEISKRVEKFSDNTPSYQPKNILSPEYHGTSNYEEGIKIVREETEQKLARLRKNPDASEQEIKNAEEDLKTLDYLYENYHIGMNVFRTAHGGRSKLRE